MWEASKVKFKEPGPGLESFCLSHKESLVGVLTLYCGKRDVAEEFAQEALARACRDWSKIRRLDDPDAWLYRVAFNVANSYFRRKSVERRAMERLIAMSSRGERDQDFVEVVASELELREAVMRIPDRPRRALILRYYADLPVAAVADVLGCPEGTAKTLIHRGIQALRQSIPQVEAPEVR